MFESQSASGCQIRSFAVGPLQCNCTILWDQQSRDAILVDPGDEAEKIIREIEKEKLRIRAIIHTHAHFDHIGASAKMRDHTKAPLLVHPGEKWLWDNVATQGRMFGISTREIGPWSEDLDHEKIIPCGSYSWKTIFTPGHTPGSCSFLLDNILIAGDTLFQNSIGRTDLWGGDFDTIKKSIQQRLYTLDDDTIVICGHGPNTAVGIEKRSNPFVTG